MRGLKCPAPQAMPPLTRRIPYGMRGLKSSGVVVWFVVMPSHPIRDAWIEITLLSNPLLRPWSHPIRDAWIEIAPARRTMSSPCRIPYGMRGLKCHVGHAQVHDGLSHPIRDAWIEISSELITIMSMLSHPIRDAWIEMLTNWSFEHVQYLSHPIRDAWIEIMYPSILRDEWLVASHTGCVD